MLACLIAIVYAGSLVRNKRQSGNFLLPDGAEFILSKSIDNSFVCSDEGIYADTNNNCQIFHVCHITGKLFKQTNKKNYFQHHFKYFNQFTENPDGSADLRQYSFLCGNQTIFNQFSLTCATPEESVPCEYAPEFYDLNKRVQEGRADVLLHNEADIARLESVRLNRN